MQLIDIKLLILSSLLPGELGLYEFINIIRYKNPKLEIIIILKDLECAIFDYNQLKQEKKFKYLLLKHYEDSESAYKDFLKLIGKMCKKSKSSKYFSNHKTEDNRMAIVSNIVGNKFKISGINVSIIFGKEDITFSTTGVMLLMTFCKLSIKLSISKSKSALSSANPTTRLSQDAFIEFIEPSIVSVASFAVVPAIPILSCITLIALTILPKDKSPSFTVIFNSYAAWYMPFLLQERDEGSLPHASYPTLPTWIRCALLRAFLMPEHVQGLLFPPFQRSWQG